MAIDLKKYEQLKKAAVAAQREADRSAGVIEQLEKRLRSEYEVETLQQAKALLKKLQAEQRKAEEEYEQRYSEFAEKYPELEG